MQKANRLIRNVEGGQKAIGLYLKWLSDLTSLLQINGGFCCIIYNLQFSMEEPVKGLKNSSFSKRTDERLKRFDQKTQQFHRSFEERRPYFQKLSIIGSNSIDFIQKSDELQLISKNGVIVCSLYKVTNSSDNQRMTFRGSCFLVTAKLAICCSHQVLENISCSIKIDGRLLKDSNDYVIKVKNIIKNSIDKIQPGESKAENYAFLVLEPNETIRTILDQYLRTTNLTSLKGIQHSMFNFDATIYGYFQKLPKQFHTEEVEMKKWLAWKPKDLIKSSGTAEYSNSDLSYTVSTEFGFTGAPIVLVHEGKSYIVGFHTRGSYFHSKNYGVLFNQAFFSYLQKVSKAYLHENFDNKRIASLSQIVKFKINLKDKLKVQHNIDFIGKALEKIIKKVAQFEAQELLVEQLPLENIIISNISNDDFQLDFTRLKLNDLVSKGGQDLSNLRCISTVIQDIEKLILQKFQRKCISPLPFEQAIGSEDYNKQKEPLIVIIKICLLDFFQKPNTYGSTSVQRLSAAITYAYEEQQNLYLFAQRQMNIHIGQATLEQQNERKLDYIVEMAKYKLEPILFRKKFCLYIKYSEQRLSQSVVLREYLVKFSYFYKQIEKVARLFIQLWEIGLTYVSPESMTLGDPTALYKRMIEQLKNFQMLKEAPKFTFLFKNFHNQSYYLQDDKQLFAKNIKKAYSDMINDLQVKVSEEEINILVKYQYVFCCVYGSCFSDITRELRQSGKQTILRKMIEIMPEKIWQELKQKVSRQPPHLLNQKNLTIKPLNIYETNIFKDVFIHNEHTVFNKLTFDIADMTSQQQRDNSNIINILVQIKHKKKGISVGAGFFLNYETVCTARHIIDITVLEQYQIVPKDSGLKCDVLSFLTSFSKNAGSSDILFLKVEVFQRLADKKTTKRSLYPKNIYMLDSDYEDQKKFNGMSYFGTLMGLRSVQKEKSTRPTMSYGQIKVSSDLFHPLIGGDHLSGSPIFTRIDKKNQKNEIQYEYLIMGVYSGLNKGSDNKGFATMQKFRSQFFKVKESFLSQIKFQRLNQCINQIQDSFIQFIVKIYSSLDHFILIVMGQIMRLNSVNIYLKKLTINNIIFGQNFPANVAFSSVPFEVHLESGRKAPNMYENEKRELEALNKFAFMEFIESLLRDKANSTFDANDKLVKQSLLIKHLQLLKQSDSLIKYYTTYLQGKYYFEKESCTLKPYQNLNQEMFPSKLQYLPQESKFEKIFKRMPAEHLARMNLTYSLLKNTDLDFEAITDDNRSSIVDRTYFKDIQTLKRYLEQPLNCNHFYFFAKKILRDGIQELLAQDYNNTAFLFEGNQTKDLKLFQVQFAAYLKNLTEFSNIDRQKLCLFLQYQNRILKRYYVSCKNWSLVSEIMNIYNSFKV